MRKRRPGGGRKPKGPIRGNSEVLQARITRDLRDRLEQEANQNKRSLSQEAQVRLKESFDLPAELLKKWGAPHIRALAQLVSQVVGSVERSVGAHPFADEDSHLSWHRNAFTHAAVSAAVGALLANYRPEGPVVVPSEYRKRTAWMELEYGEEKAELRRTPEDVGLSCARGLISQMSYMETPPLFVPREAGQDRGYGQKHYVLPSIRKKLERGK